ncbi:tRNA preQ1(34) S-adenosylmethionine ribosyltransferase-isomerase QueA [Phreatobacter stygius]|uniref:S-adenosylmethionine:tRNA ribosyltransferase-isomerase n=1 Tax=Phreatobacter stygius TaxID=1940610 RepID=A0A4D7B4I2_9HYPH|nr:tRNA preQ1(34) S-adenosylmethionine ribosyltransferase-isomerase QueA [Phreatobacter stygius]QCI68719.1 tRNA preQ1(34) S-adenosylmethionine ribosyltransferase-isomerase QueA [Phreatobacter stygius]
MRVDLFDFDLPPDRIALRPISPRDDARLMVVRPGTAPGQAIADAHIRDAHVRDLADLLAPGDALVFNDTRVIPAQLEGLRNRDGAMASISATLHRRLADDRWLAFVRGAKKVQPGDRIHFGETAQTCLLGALDATVVSKDDDGVVFAFDLSGVILDEAVARVGHVPLPPYIASKRPEDAADRADYQTVYARDEGSVAAPTAGLHFTAGLMDRLRARGIDLHFLTLHVGAGTFLPVKSDDTADHKMHPEFGLVTPEVADALNRTRARGGRIVAVGTTSLRLLESATAEDGVIRPFAAETAIFITPGYRFRAVDALMTNFHLPRSTLFMLVSAFAGLATMQAAYGRAIETGYRFYSYGDGSLLFRQPAAAPGEAS